MTFATAAAAGNDAPVHSVAIGDFDGDGVPDVAVGLPGVNVGKAKDAGEVHLYSGKSGKVLRVFQGSDDGGGYGTAIAAVGDLDGDGTTDLAISQPFARPHIAFVSGATGKSHHVFSSGKAIGYADILVPLGDGSGKTRVDLAIRHVKADEKDKDKKERANWRYVYSDREAMGCAYVDDAGSAAAGTWVGDVDGDGQADVAVTHAAGGKKGAGRVTIVSGQFLSQGNKDEIVLGLVGERPGEALGTAVAAAGDWNGDKKGDVLAGTPGDGATAKSWTARVFSGADGTVLWTASGPAGDLAIGGVAMAGDADGDGKADVAVGSPAGKGKAGSVTLLSSKDGSVLWSVKGTANEALGTEVHSAADADGDGVRDLVVLAPGAALNGVRGNGYVRVLSGKTGATICTINPLATK